MALADFFTAFVLGLLTPLTAVCVLPLYPGFLAYLANKLEGQAENKKLPIVFGIVITLGVILFMTLLGLIFTTLLEVSLTKVIGIVSPIAFGILLVISILLILDIDIGKYLPKMNAPVVKSPWFSALIFGFFFGAIVIPCNPLFIAALFTRTLSGLGFVRNFLQFIFFGVGIAFPLLAFSVISSAASNAIIGFLTKHKSIINRVAGILMLGISIYYLVFVFKVFGG
jgi:cytochrome c-type biogenesis protein